MKVEANRDNDLKYLTSGLSTDENMKKEDNELHESKESDEPKIEYFTE